MSQPSLDAPRCGARALTHPFPSPASKTPLVRNLSHPKMPVGMHEFEFPSSSPTIALAPSAPRTRRLMPETRRGEEGLARRKARGPQAAPRSGPSSGGAGRRALAVRRLPPPGSPPPERPARAAAPPASSPGPCPRGAAPRTCLAPALPPCPALRALPLTHRGRTRRAVSKS